MHVGAAVVSELARSIVKYAGEYWPTWVAFLSGGGLWAAYTLWRDRIRVSVEMLNEPFDLDGVQRVSVAPTFEVENLGSRPTSLARDVKLKGYSGVGRKPFRAVLTIKLEQRTLQPCVPMEVTAANKVDSTYVYTWYRTYTFRPTRGFRARVRVRSASCVPLGVVRFYFELARFRFTGWVYDEEKQDAEARARDAPRRRR
jgi:hypothetical protein